MLGGTRANFAGRLVAQGDYSSIAICRKNRDILRNMWNVLRYFKIFMYSTISIGTRDCVQRNPGWETPSRAMNLPL